MKILRRKVKCSSSGWGWGTVSTDLHEEQPEEQNIAEYRLMFAPRATGRGLQAPVLGDIAVGRQ